jgi:hypothetical protein
MPVVTLIARAQATAAVMWSQEGQEHLKNLPSGTTTEWGAIGRTMQAQLLEWKAIYLSVTKVQR